MKGMGRVLTIVIGIYLVLALIPAWHQYIHNATKNLDTPMRVVIRFLFDPIEYSLKWIVGCLILTISCFRRGSH